MSVKLKICNKILVTNFNIKANCSLIWQKLKWSKEKHNLFWTIILSCSLSRHKPPWNFFSYLQIKPDSFLLFFPLVTHRQCIEMGVFYSFLSVLRTLGETFSGTPTMGEFNEKCQLPKGPALAFSSLWEVHRITACLHGTLLFNMQLHISFFAKAQREETYFWNYWKSLCKTEIKSFLSILILAIVPKQGVKEGINLKFGLP